MTEKKVVTPTTARSGWHEEDIKAALKKKSGLPLWRLSQQSGFGVSVFSQVIRGFKVSAPVQAIIAQILDESPEKIWPDRYAKGKPRGKGPRPGKERAA